MTKIERINLLLETEEKRIARLEKEVTEDPLLVESRLRRGAYKQCLRILSEEGE